MMRARIYLVVMLAIVLGSIAWMYMAPDWFLFAKRLVFVIAQTALLAAAIRVRYS